MSVLDSEHIARFRAIALAGGSIVPSDLLAIIESHEALRWSKPKRSVGAPPKHIFCRVCNKPREKGEPYFHSGCCAKCRPRFRRNHNDVELTRAAQALWELRRTIRNGK